MKESAKAKPAVIKNVTAKTLIKKRYLRVAMPVSPFLKIPLKCSRTIMPTYIIPQKNCTVTTLEGVAKTPGSGEDDIFADAGKGVEGTHGAKGGARRFDDHDALADLAARADQEEMLHREGLADT